MSPLILYIVGGAGALGALAINALLWRSPRRMLSRAHCRCGYDMAGLAAQTPCPECGSAFVRHVPLLRSSRLSPLSVAVSMQPVLWGLGFASLAWACSSYPYPEPDLVFLLFVLLPFVVPLVVVMASVCLVPLWITGLMAVSGSLILGMAVMGLYSMPSVPDAEDYLYPVSSYIGRGLCAVVFYVTMALPVSMGLFFVPKRHRHPM